MTSQRSAMRAVRLGALLALTAFPAPSQGDEPTPTQGVNWRSSYADAIAEANSTGRPLWLQFTGSWCPNCVRMEQETFVDPSITTRVDADFVAVKLQADVEDELIAAFELTALPASVIVDPSRTVLGVHQGYLGPLELDEFLSRSTASQSSRFNLETPLAGLQTTVDVIGPPKPSPSSRPNRPADVALSGYCVVSLVKDRALRPGLPDLTAAYQGRTYCFADETSLAQFQKTPERYTPAIGGECPVARLDEGISTDGDPRYGALYNGQLYLCASRDERDRFFQSPDRYAVVGVEQGGDCPHCLVEDGRRVPGDPRVSLVEDHRWYWFPDESHRNAFMSLAPSPLIRR